MVVIHRHCIGIEQSSKTGWNSVGLCMCCFVFCVCCCVKRVCTIHCGVDVRLLFFDVCSFGREGWTRRGKGVWRMGQRFRFIFYCWFFVRCVA